MIRSSIQWTWKEFIVKALPYQRSALESAQPIDVLTGEALDDRRGMTLGEDALVTARRSFQLLRAGSRSADHSRHGRSTGTHSGRWPVYRRRFGTQ